METSEFGKGLTYCIGLFLAHAGKWGQSKYSAQGWASLWFGGAADHLYDLDISSLGDCELSDEIADWREKIMAWRLTGRRGEEEATIRDVYWAIQKAKDFLRQIDEKAMGIKTIKGEWE